MKELKVLSICYYGRGGSVFFQSLFDGHPECVTTPGTYISGYQEWFNQLKDLSTKVVIDEFCDKYKVFFDPNYVSKEALPCCGPSPGIDLNFSRMGESQNDSISIDESIFRDNLLKHTKNEETQNELSFFTALHLAYAETREMDLDKLKWIVFPLHTAMYDRAKFLNPLNTTIIHTVRNPLQSAASMYKEKLRRGKDAGLMGLILWMNDCYPIPGFEDVSYAVKLEDLHKIPEESMRMMCDLLGIQWHDSLLESCFGGKKWWNLKGVEQISGFNSVIIAKKHDDLLNESDKNRLESLFRDVYKEYEYPCSDKKIYDYYTKYSFEKKIPIRRFLHVRREILKIAIFRKKSRKKIPLLKRVSMD